MAIDAFVSVHRVHVNMASLLIRSFLCLAGTASLLVVGLLGFILLLDFMGIESKNTFRQTDAWVGDPSTANLDRYAKKVAYYSLVRLKVLTYISLSSKKANDASSDDNVKGRKSENEDSAGSRDHWRIQDKLGLFSCLGRVRTYEESFFDVSALTISMIAIENYNRSWLRQKAEIQLQDLAHAIGLPADYTIGLAQIRSSLANRAYRDKVKRDATDHEVRAFARSDCGSAYLASILVEEYLSDCGEHQERSSVSDYASIVGCVVQRYTGLNPESRLYRIYSTAVMIAYKRIFDREDAFFRDQFNELVGIKTINSKECIAFNPRRKQLRSKPKESGADQESKGDQTEESSAERPKEADKPLLLDAVTSLYVTPPKTPASLVKIIPSAEEKGNRSSTNDKLKGDRIAVLRQYVCARYAPEIVDTYDGFVFLPKDIYSHCDDVGDDLDSYIVLSVQGSPQGGNTSYKCEVKSNEISDMPRSAPSSTAPTPAPPVSRPASTVEEAQPTQRPREKRK